MTSLSEKKNKEIFSVGVPQLVITLLPGTLEDSLRHFRKEVHLTMVASFLVHLGEMPEFLFCNYMFNISIHICITKFFMCHTFIVINTSPFSWPSIIHLKGWSSLMRFLTNLFFRTFYLV